MKDTNCDFIRYGDGLLPDGGYLFCKNFVNQSKGLINIGIAGYDNFGCRLTNLHNMPNYQYDCNDARRPICPINNNNDHFNYVCVGSRT